MKAWIIKRLFFKIHLIITKYQEENNSVILTLLFKRAKKKTIFKLKKYEKLKVFGLLQFHFRF
jgi:hypothetical protein